MKTERRHELQTNVLANMIGHQVEAVRPFLKHLGIVALVVAIGALAITYVYRGRHAASSEAWEDYYSALAERDPNRLSTVAENHPGTEAGLWAKESEADLELASGLEMLFFDRNKAREALRRAEKRFAEISQEAKADSLVAQKAQFGLGQAKEAQDQIEDARKCYETVVRDAGDSPLGKQAQERLALLKQPVVEKWYGWFARQKPAVPPKPTGADSQPPSDLGKLSDTPDMSLPTTPGTTADTANVPVVTEPASKPADASPAAPADTKPAEPPQSPSPAPASPAGADAAKPAEAAPTASPPPATEPKPVGDPAAAAAPEKPASP